MYAAYEGQIDAVRAQARAYVEATWRSLGSWFDHDIERFVAAVTPVAEGAQGLTATLVAAELAAVEAAVLGTAEVGYAPEVGAVTTEALRGVTADELWMRPGREVWWRLSQGAPLDAAVDAGAARADQLLTANVQLAKTHTARAYMTNDDRIVGYRRVLKGKNCGLCTTAASQRYHKRDLMPIHGHCDCGVEPIYGRHDPGRVIDIYQSPDAEEPAPFELHHHGELGPVLVRQSEHFTGPSDIP